MESLTLRRSDAELAAEVYRPDIPGQWPAVVVAPGGLARGDITAYRWAGERLAAAGYVAIVTTYSTASPSEDAEDLSLAVDWLSQEQYVDSERLALFGHSRGGLAALMLAASEPRVRAVISIATPADLAKYVRSLSAFAPSAGAAVAQFLGGQPEDVPSLYERLEASYLAARIRQPVLLIHGAADMRVPVEYAATLESALREAGNSRVQLEVIPGMGHFLELGTLGYQFDRVVALAESWLKDQLG